MKKEFEESQKSNPLAGGMSGGNPLGNFDMAGWMAGSTAKTPAKSSGAEGSGAGGGKARKRG